MFSPTICRLAWIVLLALAFTAVGQEKNPAITDPAKADADFAIQGEYSGELANDEGKAEKYGVQVVAAGAGKFRAVGYRGGLPGDGWDKGKKFESSGQGKDGVTEFPKFLGTAVIKNGVLTVTGDGGAKRGELKRVLRQSPTQGAKPPDGAVVLFDGSGVEHLTNGKLTEDKLLTAGARSKQSFKDFTVHLEFRIPYQCKLNGNSGVFLQDMYEIQIIDWFGREPAKGGNAAIYGFRSPDVNMSFPPLSWQTFDVQYTAARFDGDGKVTANPVVTMRHNGVVIHDNYEMPPKATSGSKSLSPQGGPLYLQLYGGSPVHFRNIWVVEKK